MTQVPSKGLWVADPDCDRSRKARSIFMQIAFRAVQQLVFYGKLLFNNIIAELILAQGNLPASLPGS
jgi:hypothetical protein